MGRISRARRMPGSYRRQQLAAVPAAAQQDGGLDIIPASLAARDAAYRLALGIPEGQPLPKRLGRVSHDSPLRMLRLGVTAAGEVA